MRGDLAADGIGKHLIQRLGAVAESERSQSLACWVDVQPGASGSSGHLRQRGIEVQGSLRHGGRSEVLEVRPCVRAAAAR